MADNLQRIRNQLIQGLIFTTILRQLNVENLENDRLDSLQFLVDWTCGLVADSFPVAPEAVLTRTRCIKGRPHQNLSPFPPCPATLTSFLPSLSLLLKNK